MSLIKEIGEAFSFKRSKHEDKRLTTETERRLLLIGITIVLFALAMVTLLSRSIFGSSALQSCRGVILQQEKNDCLFSLANRTSNYSVCSYLSPDQYTYQCIATVAENRKNVSICSMINSSNPQYNNCIERVSYLDNNVNECLLIKGANESECAFSIAREDGFTSINYCNSIANSSQKSLCSNIYYYNTGVLSSTPSYCAELPDVSNSTLLALLVSKDNTNQTESTSFNFLAASTLNVSPRSYCYYSIARSTQNRALCALATGAISSECYDSFNVTNSTQITNVSSLCASAPSYLKALCSYSVFTEKALAEQNVSACLVIANKTYVDTCIVQLAARYKDGSYCTYINNTDTAQQACYSSASLNISTTIK